MNETEIHELPHMYKSFDVYHKIIYIYVILVIDWFNDSNFISHLMKAVISRQNNNADFHN